MHILVLGSGAGGGLPQWNCGCANCASARLTDGLKPATQTSLAISANKTDWFLINAAPDLRQQLQANAQLHPAAGMSRHSPIAGVILTNAEIDAIAGLLTLREGASYSILAHANVLSTLAANSVFDVLRPPRVQRIPLLLDREFMLTLPDGSSSGLNMTPFAVPGKSAWYLEGSSASEEDKPGDTIGLQITGTDGKRCYIIPACARVTDDLAERLHGAALVMFDGTLWHDDEMIHAGLASKRGRDMGHVSMSGPDGAIAALAEVNIARRIFIHINNSNPVWRSNSDERKIAEQAGWEVGFDGMEIVI